MASRKGAPGLSGPGPQRNQLPRPGRFPRAWSNPPMLDGVVEMLQSCHAAVDGRRACAVRPHAATVATPGGTQMNGTRTRVLIAPLAGIAMLASGAVAAAEKLTLYCSPQIEWCQLMVSEFEKTTGIDVAMTRKSSGETFAQIRAESRNPKGDVWWGGTGDPHLQAAEEGLTEQYDSPMLAKLHDWAQRQSRDSSKRTVGIYAGALGFGYNRELLAKHGLPTPACWKDLTKPEYKGHVQMANPNSSGTAYTTLATIVQIFGEDEGFEFMKALHRNINQYTKSGSAPIKAAARGETTIGITFQHDIVTQVVNGFPVEIVSPCEGTGYEIGSMSGHPADGGQGQGLPGALECERLATATGTGSVQDQAHRLRLQEVRLLGRAQASARQVGRRGEVAAALSARTRGWPPGSGGQPGRPTR
jgi:iron(III) transport system substrate-binding protein